MPESGVALILAPGRARALVERSGPGARLAAEEFFAGKLSNPHTLA